MGYRNLAGQRGLSLIEVMVTVMVLVVGLAAIHHLFPQGLVTGRHALDRTRATLLGRGKLEQLRSQDFETLAATLGTAAPATPFLDSQEQTMYPQFRWQAEVKQHAADLLELQLRVTWPWPRQTHAVSLATYVSRR